MIAPQNDEAREIEMVNATSQSAYEEVWALFFFVAFILVLWLAPDLLGRPLTLFSSFVLAFLGVERLLKAVRRRRNKHGHL